MAAIKITGRMVNFSRLTFTTNDLEQIRQELLAIIGQDDSYLGTPVIIHSTVEQNLIELVQLLLEVGLQPMAAIDGILGDDARTIEFPVLPPDQPVQRIIATSHAAGDSDDAVVVAPASRLAQQTAYHDEVLRTGQSLVQENGDLVLIAGMNSGSEIIASGNIYIYGTARGRVIAGAAGDLTTRIFCQSLEAELVSIAGTYCVAEDIPREFLKKPVQICLNSQQVLEFLPLSI